MKYISLIILCLTSLCAMANSGLPNHRHIVVHGAGQIITKPDMAKITFEVSSVQDDALAAKKEVDKRVNALLNGLEKYNVNDDNVSASSLLTEPHVNYTDEGLEVIAGYVATRTLKVTLSELAQMNEFIDFALSVGINEIEDIKLLSIHSSTLKNQATTLAVEDAKTKGAALANAFGANLGKIYSINSSNSSSRYGYSAYSNVERIEVAGSKIDADDLAPGRYLQATINFSASITVVFDLEVE
ncbi:SIMPL domain-containing protein [Shewanella colwelliana]|uniref:SIMPL domain-containing protein n=1 Tax=Shewanella colwelliana TaxID=23 RepID=UPI00373629DF